jgi:hypothetical protein
VTFASLIVDFFLKLVPSSQELLDPDLVVRKVADIVAGLPQETRVALVRRDRAQLEAVLDYLEGWWALLTASLSDGGSALEGMVRSRFFEVTHDEGALTRFALEVRLSAMVFGDDASSPLLARLAAMDRATTEVARRVLTAQAGAAEKAGATASAPARS